MSKLDKEAIMSKDMVITLYTKSHGYNYGVKLPHTPFNIRSAIQLLQQEHVKLTGEWWDSERGDRNVSQVADPHSESITAPIAQPTVERGATSINLDVLEGYDQKAVVWEDSLTVATNGPPSGAPPVIESTPLHKTSWVEEYVTAHSACEKPFEYSAEGLHIEEDKSSVPRSVYDREADAPLTVPPSADKNTVIIHGADFARAKRIYEKAEPLPPSEWPEEVVSEWPTCDALRSEEDKE